MGQEIKFNHATHCFYLLLNTQETSHFYRQWFHILKNKLELKYKREKKIPRALSELPANGPGRFSQKRLVRPGQLAGNSERARGIFFSFNFSLFSKI